jgi:hypothetical protein
MMKSFGTSPTPNHRNGERNPRDAGNRAQHLDHRLQQEAHGRHASGEEADDDAEHASQEHAGERPRLDQ